MVQYKEVPNYTGYRAGDDGSIWSCLKKVGNQYSGCHCVVSDEWKLLIPDRNNKNKRARYTLRHKSGLYDKQLGARLVLFAFIGPCPDDMEACHNNGDCTNDALYNVRWDTHESNMLDRVLHGTNIGPCGESHGQVKLADDQIHEILTLRKSGETLASIADMFDVSYQYIGALVNGKHRRDITSDNQMG